MQLYNAESLIFFLSFIISYYCGNTVTILLLHPTTANANAANVVVM